MCSEGIEFSAVIKARWVTKCTPKVFNEMFLNTLFPLKSKLIKSHTQKKVPKHVMSNIKNRKFIATNIFNYTSYECCFDVTACDGGFDIWHTTRKDAKNGDHRWWRHNESLCLVKVYEQIWQQTRYLKFEHLSSWAECERNLIDCKWKFFVEGNWWKRLLVLWSIFSKFYFTVILSSLLNIAIKTFTSGDFREYLFVILADINLWASFCILFFCFFLQCISQKQICPKHCLCIHCNGLIRSRYTALIESN